MSVGGVTFKKKKDHAGLLCARDLNAAASAFLKLSSGLSTTHVTGDLSTYMSHVFFFSSRRRHTRSDRDWSSDVCSSDLYRRGETERAGAGDDQHAHRGD